MKFFDCAGSAGLRRAYPLALCGMLAACGGGGGDSDPDTGACGVNAQKQWIAGVVPDWYLFPETLPASVDPAAFRSTQDLLDYMTSTARDQGRDRYWSYVTTASEDQAYFQEGQYPGYGFALGWYGSSVQDARLFVRWSFENSPAWHAGLLRGAEITHIDAGSGFRPVRAILADGNAAFAAAMGPGETGVRRGFRWNYEGSQYHAYVTQDVVTIVPVAGNNATVLPAPGSAGVGYLHLVSFISTAETPLRATFDEFRRQGITDYIVDLRYNGGGLVSVEQLLANLMAATRNSTDVLARVEFNGRHTDYNSVDYFAPQAESVAPLRIAFITTNDSASASEAIVNEMKPYAQVAIVGSDSYGKPVGQIGLQQEGCDMVLRLIGFRRVNSRGEGDFFRGLAETMPGNACAAPDQLDRMPGDPDEASTRAALDWLSFGSCADPMPAGGAKSTAETSWHSELRGPPRSAAQENVPGIY